MNYLAIVSVFAAYISATSIKAGGDKCKLDNFEKNPESCAHMDVSCLNQVAANSMKQPCLKLIPETVLQNMSSEAAGKLMQISVKEMPLEKVFFLNLFKRHTWSKNNEEDFLVNLIANNDHAVLALEALSGSPEEASRIFNGKNAATHNSLCAKINKEMMPFITTTFFKNMKVICFRQIPDVAFEAITADQLEAITGENLKNITVKQAEKIPAEAFSKMTGDQAKNWGLPFNPPEGEDKDSKQKYLEAHPCSLHKKMVAFMQKQSKLALESHCKIKASGAMSMSDISLTKVYFWTAFAAGLVLLF